MLNSILNMRKTWTGFTWKNKQQILKADYCSGNKNNMKVNMGKKLEKGKKFLKSRKRSEF